MNILDLQSLLEAFSQVYQDNDYDPAFLKKVTQLILAHLRSFDQPETISTTLVMSLIKSYKSCRYSERDIL